MSIKKVIDEILQEAAQKNTSTTAKVHLTLNDRMFALLCEEINVKRSEKAISSGAELIYPAKWGTAFVKTKSYDDENCYIIKDKLFKIIKNY